MQPGILFLLLSIGLTTVNTASTSDTTEYGVFSIIEDLLTIGIRIILLNLKRIGSITLTEDSTITIPDSIKTIVLGTINLKNANMYGLDNLQIINVTVNASSAPSDSTTTETTETTETTDSTTITAETSVEESDTTETSESTTLAPATTDSPEVRATRGIEDTDTSETIQQLKARTIINLDLKLTFDKLGVKTNYDADVGILNEVPLYGDGELNLAISNVEIDLNVNLVVEENFAGLSVDGLSLALKLHDSPSYITKFWKNDEASTVLTVVINILEKFVCMWIAYENECINCVVSQVLEYVINSMLSKEALTTLDLTCSCLGSYDSTYNLEENLESLVPSVLGGNLETVVKNLDKPELTQFLSDIMDVILQKLNQEGYSINP